MPKVLLADDSTHAQRMGSKILAGEGIEVITVNNGEAAVKKLAANSFDLVLADVFMPGRSGYELCGYIKNSPKLALTPVILIVGLLEPYDADQGKSVGADAVLRKPFETTIVVETVRRLLEAARQRRAAMMPPEMEKTQILTAPMARPAPPPAPGAEEAVPEMQVAAPSTPGRVAIPPEMGNWALDLGEQPAALQAERAIPALELEHLLTEPEARSQHAALDLPPVAAGPPPEAVVAPPVDSAAGQPIESAAPFDFAELQMAAVDTAPPVAFELPREQARALEAQLSVAPAVAAPPVAEFPTQIEIEPAEAPAPLETPVPPAALEAPVLTVPPEPRAEPSERPHWIIEPEPGAEPGLGAWAEAAPVPAIETAGAQPAATPSPAVEAQPAEEPAEHEMPVGEAAPAAAVAAVEPEPVQEALLAEAVEPATMEPVPAPEAPPLAVPAQEPAVREEAMLARPAVPLEPRETTAEGELPAAEAAEEAAAREAADREVRAFEVRQPATGAAIAESAPPAPTPTEIDQAVAHAAEPPAEPRPTTLEVPDWTELLKTVEQTPAPEARPPIEAAAEPAAPPSPAAPPLSAIELREAVESGLNAALPGITALPGLVDTVMREVLRRFDSIR